MYSLFKHPLIPVSKLCKPFPNKKETSPISTIWIVFLFDTYPKAQWAGFALGIFVFSECNTF